MKISKQTVFYNTLILTLSNMVLQVLAFLYRIMLSRILGSTGMGVFQLVFPAISVVMSFCASGFSMAVSRMSAEAYALGDLHAVQKLVAKSQIAFSVLLSFMTLPLWFFSKEIATHLLGDSRVAAALMISPFYIFLTGIENLYKSCFYGIKKVGNIAFSEITELLIRMGSVAVLLLCFGKGQPGKSAALIMVGMFISEVFSATYLNFVYKKRMPSDGTPSHQIIYKVNLRKILQVAIPVSLAGVLNNLIGSANSVMLPKSLVLSGMTNEDSIKIFGVLVGMVIPLFMLPFGFIGSLSSVIMAKVAEGTVLSNLSDIRRKTAKAIHATSLLAMPCISVLIPLAPAICRLIYHQEIPRGVIWPLAIATLLNYFRSITSTVLYGLGMDKRASFIAVSGELIHLAFTVFVVSIPSVGLLGYLAGYGISSLYELILNVIFIKTKTKLRIMWVNWFIQPGLTAALSGFAAKFTYRWLSASSLSDAIRLIISIAFAAVIYALLLSLQGVRLSAYLKRISGMQKPAFSAYEKKA